MTRGLVIGKFYPPHLGHHHLLSSAARQVDRLTVLAMASRAESVGLDERVRWLREVHRDEPVDVVGTPCDIPMDLGSDPVWSAHVAMIRAASMAHSPDVIDVVFSSEDYGPELARRLGARHSLVDRARVTHPISGTAVRADVARQWERLHPVVRAGLATRIVVLGAESTGTTTVSRALADHYRSGGGVWTRTQWVPEYGREHTVLKHRRAVEVASGHGMPLPPLEDVVWRSEDFAYIARRQLAYEERAARRGSPVLICDTDPLATRVWERRYMGGASHAAAEAVPELPQRSMYLLTDHDEVPFVQDGWRDGERVRADMTGWFIDELTAHAHSWALLTGSLQDRIALARRIIDELLRDAGGLSHPIRTGPSAAGRRNARAGLAIH